MLTCSSNENAFKLYDTYGFPFELTKEIAEENGLKADEAGFKVAMKEQKDRAKAATQKISVTGDIKYAKVEEKVGATEFIGYTDLECDAKILEVLEGEGYVDVVLDKTPFYAECGGQVGDSGVIESDSVKLDVLTTFKVNKLFVHRCELVNGEIESGATVHAVVDKVRRGQIKVHHTSAHLLQSALQQVLSGDVHQAGSQVEEDRMRFDFTFDRAMTDKEVQKTEDIINEWISEDIDVSTKVMNIDEAKATGAMALFGEKYEDEVRVVSVGDISKEFCAGCHASSTGQLRLAKIVSESAIAAGTRRIEVVVAKSALKYLSEKANAMDKLATKFKAHYDEVEARVDKLQEENKELQKELTTVKSAQAKDKFKEFASKAVDIDGGKLFVQKMEQIDANALKEGVEMLANKLGDSVIVVVAGTSIFVKVADNFVAKGVNAGNIVKEIAQATEGKGGGRPQFAQGAVKNLDKVDEVLAKIDQDLKG